MLARSRWPPTTRVGCLSPGPVTTTDPSCMVTTNVRACWSQPVENFVPVTWIQ